MVGLSSIAVEAVEVLVKELGVLLKMLDQEKLSKSTQEKKTSVWNLLQQIQTTGQGKYTEINMVSVGC
ncbi:hypothetical protein ATANTOWER_016825 [Ataeniobius toweri]|uniref:RPW8 domain-containing protein n=1 Tax=Ataeniobius toweri TaxID=208326 RepID=A0ABU7BT75_9TELE|nr:hypothetical protein [Ataeniobius toweri]